MYRECGQYFHRNQLQRTPLVRDPGMHHGTCVTHVLWCMSGSLTRSGGENVPGITGACANRNFTYLAKRPQNTTFHDWSTRLWGMVNIMATQRAKTSIAMLVILFPSNWFDTSFSMVNIAVYMLVLLKWIMLRRRSILQYKNLFRILLMVGVRRRTWYSQYNYRISRNV